MIMEEMKMEKNEETQVKLIEAEFTKINLGPGDTLFVNIKSDDVDETLLESFRSSFEKAFPNNRVALFLTTPSDSIEFTSVQETVEMNCSTNVCSDCNCGKKEG